MIGKFANRLAFLFFADTAIIGSGLVLALYLRLGLRGTVFQMFEENGWLKVILVTAISLFLLYFYDLYDYVAINNRRELVLRLTKALSSAWLLLVLIFYFAPSLQLGRGTSLYSILITLISLLAVRCWIHFLLGHPEIGEKVLIVGDGQTAVDTAKAVLKQRDAGYRIAGFITRETEIFNNLIPGKYNLGTIDDLERIVPAEKINLIVIALRERRGTFPTETLLKMSLAGDVNIEECASFFERVTGQVHLDMVRPSWLIFGGRKRDTQLKTFFRETIHRLLALAGLLCSLPIIVITAICIKFDSKGSIFYRQQRVGKNGHTFDVIKFRSMKTDAEKDGKPVWATADDDRTTRVGRVIRKVRIDEIPQFLNIIKGEMSFVGPRPERPHFVAQLAEEIPYYEHRHLTPPGLTGWAQIKHPYGASVEDARSKLQYDLYYIKNQSLALDLIIIFETVKTVLFRKGGR